MIIVRLLSTRAFMVGLAPPSLLGPGSRHCYGINFTHRLDEASARLGNHKSAELPQLPTNHRDRPGWQCVHAVGRGGDRDVLIVSRSIAILHQSYRSDERVAHVLGIVDDEMNLVSRVQIVVN